VKNGELNNNPPGRGTEKEKRMKTRYEKTKVGDENNPSRRVDAYRKNEQGDWENIAYATRDPDGREYTGGEDAEVEICLRKVRKNVRSSVGRVTLSDGTR
jgi:hypothetical protein